MRWMSSISHFFRAISFRKLSSDGSNNGERKCKRNKKSCVTLRSSYKDLFASSSSNTNNVICESTAGESKESFTVRKRRLYVEQFLQEMSALSQPRRSLSAQSSSSCEIRCLTDRKQTQQTDGRCNSTPTVDNGRNTNKRQFQGIMSLDKTTRELLEVDIIQPLPVCIKGCSISSMDQL